MIYVDWYEAFNGEEMPEEIHGVAIPISLVEVDDRRNLEVPHPNG